MRSVFLLALAAMFSAALSAQQSGTFFSTFDAGRGSIIAPAAAGNLWLGGQKDERVLLAKLNPEGKILEKHSVGFEGTGLDLEHLTDLFEESDGSLVGCGNFEGDNFGRGFVFRYNPATRQTLWAHVVRSGSLNYLYGITQLGPGGDYVLYGNPHNTAGNDAELLQLSRTTGQIVTGKAKRFGIGPSDNIIQALYHNGAMYTCGRFTGTEPYPPARMRNAVCKIDTATLEPVWTRTGPLPTSSSGQFHGRDLIIDNETIVSTFSGDHASPDLLKSEVYLQKNDLDGNLLWVRQYKLPAFAHEFAEEIINLPDGYLLYGHDIRADTSRLFLLKTDKEGNAVMAVIIDFGLNDEFPEIPARSKILRLGDALFFTALSENNSGQTQGILVKADLNGLLAGSCDFVQQTPVTFSDWDSAMSQSFVPTVTAGTASLAAATISQTTPDLTFEKKCGATGTCPTLPDLSVTLDSITCTDGNSRLHFTVCNVGGQPYDGPSTLFIYDRNPLTGPAKFITGSIGGGQPIPPGECISWGSFGSDVDFQMPYELDTFTRLYALIGANYTVTTPIPISGFPYPPNQPECNYLNNLDSISIPAQLCGDCQTPVTFVKKLGAPQRRELAFSMCTSADGNVYVAGKQGNNPMIAKITTQGEQIWVRNFPPINPNEPIEWAQIIEDSDGKIVVCGTEGASPSNRRAIVMRYDPTAGAVLWYKRYQSDKPMGVAIVEKSPGGDFVLQANYQTVGSGGVSAQTQFYTLNRADGNTKGSSVGYQNLDNNIVIANTVLNNGKLYTVGSWVTKTNDKALPFFARVSPNTFIPEWAYLSIPDTSSGAARWMPPTDVAFDGDIAIVAGSGHLNPLTPTENIFVYLQKHNPDGSLVWLKRYDMEMVPEEVLALPNAYIVFGRMVGANRFGMLKTDLQGNVLRAAVLEAAPASLNSVGFVSRQGLLLRLPLQLLMLDHTWENTESDLVLLRTDLNFGLDDDCDLLQSVQVSSSTLSATTEPAQFGIGTNTPASAALPANAVFQADSLPLRKLCPACSCAGKPDISFGVTEIQCTADNTYEFKTKTCNTGDVAAPTPFEVVFYDKNPLTEAATALWSMTVNQPVGPGGCVETTESLPAVATQYPKIYAFAGAPAGTTTPIDLGLLAANADFPDCHWENNLDSFTIDPTLCPADSCQPNTFLKVYGEIIKQDNIAALRAAPDGNIYVAGGKADGYAIGKMTPTGDILWLRNITGTIHDRVFVTEIIVDSEGMIVGCGRRNSLTGNETVAFRYNPGTNQILWEQRFGVNNPVEGGILEKKPGGNYLIYRSPDYSPLGRKSAEILELDRTTGQIVPAFANRYAQQVNQVFAGIVQHGDALYTTGYTDSLLPLNQVARRMTLTKLDANTGNVLWTRLGLTPWSQTSYFRGIDLIVDDNSLIVLSHGIETSNTSIGSGKVVPVYLHKTTLDGDLLWAKKYLLTEVPREVVAVPDGYVIFCGNNKRHFLKTDKEGDLLFAKALNTPDYFSAGFDDWQKNQIERVGSYLYITDFSAKGNIAGQFTTVLKTDLNLGLEFDCGLEFLAVSHTAMTNPVLFAAQQTATMSPATAQAVTLTNTPGSIAVHSACPFCPDPPCSDKPDISFRIESVGCDSAAFVAYRLCNTGKQPFTGTLQVGVYDSNPMTGAATLLDLFSLPTLNLAPDSCQTGTLKNLGYWGNYNKVYTLAGIESGQTTPVNLAGFPYNGIAECDYANNLDSLAFQYPPALLPDLGPDTAICPGDTLLLGINPGVFVSYTWHDGSIGPMYPVTGAGIFSLTTKDGCGRTASDNIVISLKNQPKVTREIVLLPGDSVIIGGMVYKTSAQVISYEPSSSGGCDTLVTNNIRLDSLHCDQPGAFFKAFKGISSRVVLPAADGGYYVGGGTLQGLTLAKFDATGKKLWTRHFNLAGSALVQTLLEDSEGMLAGSATSEGSPSVVWVFRYDPTADQMLWIRRETTNFEDIRGYELVERKPGGDYLLALLRRASTVDFKTEMATFDRATGNIANGDIWRYNEASLTSIEIKKDTLYAFSILRDNSMAGLVLRNGLVKIDLNTGTPIWAKLTETAGAELFGGNLLLDDDGNLVTTMIQPGQAIWLQKTAPDGGLLWLKKIRVLDPTETQFFPLGLVRLNDGYAIGIQTSPGSAGPRSYVVVRTDKNGNLVWAKKVPNVGGTLTFSQHQLASRGNEVCFTTNLYQQVLQMTGMVLGKFDQNGNLGGSCLLVEDSPVVITQHAGSQVSASVHFAKISGAFDTPDFTNAVPLSVQQFTFCSSCLPPCDSTATQQVLEFYPGDTIFLAGTPYTQPDTVTLTLTTGNGCDSVVTYILRRVITNVDLACPPDMTVAIPANQSSVTVAYPLPAAATDCPDPGITLKRLQGPPPGGLFPEGTTPVCYEAANQCGIRGTCCFAVTAQKTAHETACDVKTPAGSCIKYELLEIRLDALGRPRYRFRLTNTCASPLQYAHFQLPDGITAKAPVEGSTYTAAGGNTYLVRNPNAAPFHSVRFKSLSGALNNGKSDVFEYTLPRQSQPLFILVSVKLADGNTYDAHLNTFACPVQPYVASAQEPGGVAQNRGATTEGPAMLLRPNPTSGLLLVDLQTAEPDSGQPVLVSVLNAQGQLVLEDRFIAENNRISLLLPEGLASGLYYLTAQPTAGGIRSAARFVLER